MNQVNIGKFISKKRREKNLTQEQLGEKLGVSHKSVSKWETGKCMPDYSIIEALCQELHITISELIDGEEHQKEVTPLHNNDQILDMLARIQGLETQRTTLMGTMLIVMGMALTIQSHTIEGSAFMSFFSGVMLGLGVGVTLVGVFLAISSVAKP